jgi:hypothetical protein
MIVLLLMAKTREFTAGVADKREIHVGNHPRHLSVPVVLP